jgi:hypothetical protein
MGSATKRLPFCLPLDVDWPDQTLPPRARIPFTPLAAASTVSLRHMFGMDDSADDDDEPSA